MAGRTMLRVCGFDVVSIKKPTKNKRKFRKTTK
jgi:hypothetical protein